MKAIVNRLLCEPFLSSCRRALKPAGTYVGVGPPAKAEGLGMLSRFLQMLIFSRLTSHKLVTFLARPKRDGLVLLGELLATGKIIPIIDRTYRLPEAAEALRFLQEGHPWRKNNHRDRVEPGRPGDDFDHPAG